MALKELLGAITLEPVLNKDADLYQLFAGNEKNFKPYYVAHTKIQTLALIDEEHKGSNWYHWRRVEDLNLRSSYDDNGFRDRRIRPLCQLSNNTKNQRFFPQSSLIIRRDPAPYHMAWRGETAAF